MPTFDLERNDDDRLPCFPCISVSSVVEASNQTTEHTEQNRKHRTKARRRIASVLEFQQNLVIESAGFEGLFYIREKLLGIRTVHDSVIVG